MRRIKVSGNTATYHVMSHVVSGTPYFDDRAKEVLRKMIWQVADFSGVEVLTYCVMSNHFHVLVRVPPVESRLGEAARADSAEASRSSSSGGISDTELLRRYRALYPRPTKYRTARIQVMEQKLAENGEEAAAIRERLLARMGDISEYMKTLKQRFSVWYNRTHGRVGTLWSERFKSVLVEGRGNPLQTMAAYIDLNPVRAGLVDDPKDYRYCGYAEAVAGRAGAKRGLRTIWGAYADGCARDQLSAEEALRIHRETMFGYRAAEPGLSEQARAQALQVLQKGGSSLPKAAVLHCRVRYFTDGAILGTKDYVRGFVELWQESKKRKHPPKVNLLCGTEWTEADQPEGQHLACIRGLRKAVFGSGRL
ncbi:MAG: transposase [Opitutales bacterium]